MLNVEVKVDHQIHDICAACAATKAFYNMTRTIERERNKFHFGGKFGGALVRWSPRFYPFSQTTLFIINIIDGGE